MQLFALFIPILITFILSLKLLIAPKHKSISSRLLGVFFFCFSIALFSILFQYIRKFEPVLNQYFYIFEMFFYTVMLALPIIIFFYVISLTDNIKNYNTTWKVIPHFYIPIQALIFNVYSFINNTSESQVISRALDYTNFFSLKIIFVLLNLTYLSATLYIYRKHRLKIKEVFSFERGISFNWISVFITGYLLFVGCFFTLNPNSSPFIVYLPLLLIISYMLFQRNTQVNTTLINNDIEIKIEEKNNKLDAAKRNVLKLRINDYMRNHKPYLQNDLTLYQLAKMLDTNSSYLSAVINAEFNTSFVSFINSYRIDESKILLTDINYNDITIEAVGEKAGFNSKSAFNRAFKKHTKITPSEYKKNNH